MTDLNELITRAGAAYQAGDRSTAMRLLDQAVLDGRSRLAVAESPDVRTALVDATMTKANVAEREGDLHSALELSQEAAEMAAPQHGSPAGLKRILAVGARIAHVAGRLREWEIAKAAWQPAIDALRPYVRDHDDPEIRLLLVHALMSKAVEISSGEKDEALALCAEAETLARKPLGCGPKEARHILGKILENAAEILKLARRYAEAEAALREALRWMPEGEERAYQIQRVAELAQLQGGDHSRIEDLLEWATAELRTHASGRLLLAAQLVRRASFHAQHERPNQAARDLTEVVEILGRIPQEVSMREDSMLLESTFDLLHCSAESLDCALAKTPPQVRMFVEALRTNIGAGGRMITGRGVREVFAAGV